ncbi:hypothetical protein [Vibrio cholerae]|nr:hypothetical protein [Vibrio cholerae]
MNEKEHYFGAIYRNKNQIIKNPAAAGFFIIDFSLRNKEMNRF